MKTTRLTIGIITIFLSLILMFQSCVFSVGSVAFNADKNDGGGFSGIFIAIFWVIAGIVSITGRKSRGGAIASVILYGLCGIIGTSASTAFKDLSFWGGISFLFSFVFFIAIFLQKYKASVVTKETKGSIDS